MVSDSYLRRWIYYEPVSTPIEHPVYPEDLTLEQEENLSERILQELEKLNEKSKQLAEELEHLIQGHPDALLWDPLEMDAVKDSLYKDDVENLQQIKEEIENQLQNDPFNDDLLKQLEDIEKQLKQLDSERNEDILKQEEKEEDTAPPPDVPDLELKSIDLQPIVDLKGEMMSKFPFCMLQAVGGMFDILTAPPKAPSFDINLGLGTVHCDLSALDSFAAFVRGVMSFLIFGLCGFACFKLWSRF